MPRIFLYIICVITASYAAAQPKQQYLFSHFGTRHGLASNEIMAVEQDQKGFIWIASLSGLQRFDGRRLLNFQHNPANPYSIPEGGVHMLQFDRHNRLWLLSSGNRVGYFNLSDHRYHAVAVEYPEVTRREAEARLSKDRDGNIFLVLLRTDVLTYNLARGKFSPAHNPFPLPTGWRPNDVYQDRDSTYWIPCDSGLVKFNPKAKTLSYRGHNTDRDPVIGAFAARTHVSMPFREASGRFWMLSWPGNKASSLLSYTPSTGQVKDWDPEITELLHNRYHETYAFRQQNDSTLWLYGNNLFAKYNKRTKSFELIEDNLPGEFSIRYDRVRHVFEDRERNLWISSNKGLFRFNPQGQFFYTIQTRRLGKDTLYTPDVSDILELTNGDILVTTWGSGIFPYDNEFNPVSRDYINQSNRMGEGLSWSILQRPNGDLWRGHQAGYLFITTWKDKRSQKLSPPELGGSTVRQLTEDRNGNIWMGTQSGRLVKWNAATGKFTLEHQFGSIIFRLYTDRRGDVWVCTRAHGVYRINSDNSKIIYHYTPDGPPNTRLTSGSNADIVQYDDSLYLIASSSLNILNIKTNTIRYFSASDGLPSNTVNNIIIDRMGHVWLTLESGLCSYNLQEGVVYSYDQNDGIPTVNFSHASATVLNDGRIAIGTSHELMVFDPAYISKITPYPPDVVISGFALMNNWLQLDSLRALPRIHLKPGQNSITIEFSTLTFQNSYGISYMMENLDKDWLRRAGSQNQAVYNYLPPGDYVFKVRADNGSNTFSRNISELRITVHPPFWKTWWFFCLLALLVATIIYWLDRERVNKLIALQNVRSEIAGNLHEDVNTTLNNINLLSEMARIKADKEIDRSKEYIDQISTKSHNMIIAMDDILWSIDPQNDTMEKSLLRMMEFADALKHRHAATIEISIDKKVRSLKLDMKTRHEAFLIFKQALKLIVVYSGGRQTLINIDLFKNKLALRLQDETASLEKNVSLIDDSIRDMNERAEFIAADLDVQYDKSGIAVVLLVPVK